MKKRQEHLTEMLGTMTDCMPLSRARMGLVVDFFEFVRRQVGIDLGGGQIGMA